MATALIEHERITTTLAKAKELRPLVEKLIHKAKADNPQGHLFLKRTLFTPQAIKKIKEEIAPRYKDHAAGFTRVEFIGRRRNDKAQIAIIELMGNPMQEFE